MENQDGSQVIQVEVSALTSAIYQTFEKTMGQEEVGRSNYKDNRFEWLMLSLNNTLEKDNGSLREINRQLKAKYENGVVTLVAYEDTLIS